MSENGLRLLNLKRGALRAINVIRAKHGVRPLGALPNGQRSNTEQCPVLRALRDCGITEISLRLYYRDGTSELLPDILDDFVQAFDRGQFPELEIVSKPD